MPVDARSLSKKASWTASRSSVRWAGDTGKPPPRSRAEPRQVGDPSRASIAGSIPSPPRPNGTPRPHPTARSRLREHIDRDRKIAEQRARPSHNAELGQWAPVVQAISTQGLSTDSPRSYGGLVNRTNGRSRSAPTGTEPQSCGHDSTASPNSHSRCLMNADSDLLSGASRLRRYSSRRNAWNEKYRARTDSSRTPGNNRGIRRSCVVVCNPRGSRPSLISKVDEIHWGSRSSPITHPYADRRAAILAEISRLRSAELIHQR